MSLVCDIVNFEIVRIEGITEYEIKIPINHFQNINYATQIEVRLVFYIGEIRRMVREEIRCDLHAFNSFSQLILGDTETVLPNPARYIINEIPKSIIFQFIPISRDFFRLWRKYRL